MKQVELQGGQTRDRTMSRCIKVQLMALQIKHMNMLNLAFPIISDNAYHVKRPSKYDYMCRGDR